MSTQLLFLVFSISMLITNCADSSRDEGSSTGRLESFDSGLTNTRRLNTLSDQEARTLAYELDLYRRSIDADPQWTRALCLGFAIYDPYMSCEYTQDTCIEMGPQNYEINFYFDTDWNGYPEGPDHEEYEYSRSRFSSCDITVNEYENCISKLFAHNLNFFKEDSLTCEQSCKEVDQRQTQSMTQELLDCIPIVNCDDPEYESYCPCEN